MRGYSLLEVVIVIALLGSVFSVLWLSTGTEQDALNVELDHCSVSMHGVQRVYQGQVLFPDSKEQPCEDAEN
ncbi:type II secretion system protein [Aliidiomarina indica]|uniref:type II secretion system protein n=1 Tax=Aliidiomarina indica TaxID=2749147 RepID=UPI00188E33B6|nr:type II secretion system protein [Aliidiomarina indica]